MNNNIIDIHNSILQSFEDDNKLLPEIKIRIENLKVIYDNTDDIGIKDKISKEIITLEEKFSSISSNEDYFFYILQSTVLLDEYKDELNKPIEINFMGEKTVTNTEKADKIYQNFIDLIQNVYPNSIPVIETEKIQDTDKCPTCKCVADELAIDIPNILVCKCGTERDSMLLTFSYKDSERINVTTKYTYDRRIHFRECINQFQGKQNSTIKQEVYDKLIEQLSSHGLVREGSFPQTIKYEKVTKYHISVFLKEIGFANHYEDLNLIYHVITGNELDDISHLEKVLMDDFDKLSKIYDEEYIKTQKILRKNFINTQYVLYQLLKRHKYPCNASDFTFLKTIERKGFHDEICSHLFRLLGWNFYACF
jgi:hypothetical protein